jgi:DNA (cytosine-5)-methyltransferase 1
MFRVIKEFKPTWVIGENVAGILSMAQFEGDAKVGSETDLFGNTKDVHSHEGRGILYGIIEQLGEIGYAVQTFVIPAVAVNAPHRRDRVFFVANRTDLFSNGGNSNPRISTRPEKVSQSGNSSGQSNTSESERWSGGSAGEQEQSTQSGQTLPGRFNTREWEEPWLTVAVRTCSRGVDDGLPAELDGFKLSKPKHRVERLKALGNAIVPQVAIEIMRAIKLTERTVANDQV